MKPFNLEEAKAGKPYKEAWNATQVLTFLAVASENRIVSENHYGAIIVSKIDALVMLKTKKEYYYNLYLRKDRKDRKYVHTYGSLYSTYDKAFADRVINNSEVQYLKTDMIEIEE